MITEKQLSIFQEFAKNPFAELTRQSIKKSGKMKSNNALSIAMKQFMKEGLLNARKVGKSSLFSLTFNNELVYYYLALANQKRLNKPVNRSLGFVKEEMEKKTPFYTMAIFGSYATQEANEKSDLDVAVFIDQIEQRTEVERALKAAELKSLIQLDGHVITRDEFLSMLADDEENLGKQIARKHLAVHNHQLFYSLVLEGIKNGFRI